MTSDLLAGISQKTLKTERSEVAYLEVDGSNGVPVVLVHGNCSSSLFFQDLMLALAARGFHSYAPDLRGYGASEVLPVDATRGVRDFSDDLAAFARTLALPAFHLFGWSLGGNVVVQYTIDHQGTLRSLALQAPGSPFGFGGTRGPEGTPVWPDFAGSGGGTANAEFVQRLAQDDRGSDPVSPRTVLNSFYFKPPFRAAPNREEIYVTSMLTTHTGNGNYPGDATPSDNWPNVAPGSFGPNNAIAPGHLNQGELAQIAIKPSILWLHGADDQIVSDTSFFDLGFLGQVGAVPGWPGAEIYPPQPMKAQVRMVLQQYQANGGEYRELELADCGHAPHIEKADETLQALLAFFSAH